MAENVVATNNQWANAALVPEMDIGAIRDLSAGFLQRKLNMHRAILGIHTRKFQCCEWQW